MKLTFSKMEVLENGYMKSPVWAEPERAKAPLSDAVCAAAAWQPTLVAAPVGGED